MREARKPEKGEILSRALVDLIEKFERWDTIHHMGSAKVEWVEFVEELDKFEAVVRDLDNSGETW